MYHLFNSVYADSERRIDRSHNVITISPEHGHEYFPAAHEEVGKQLYWATSLDDMDVEKFLAALKEAHASENKTMIYCDGETYIRLYASLIKALMPSIDLDTFRWIMACKKATFNTVICAGGEPRVDVLSSIVISSAKVDEVYKRTEAFQEAMVDLVNDDPDALSLEWRLIRLRTEQRVGKIPKTLKNILRRIALSNAHDALEVWGRHLTREKFWDVGGCDLDSLLNAPTVFEACVNMPHLASQQLLRPGLYDFKPNDAWLKSMLKEAITLMDVLEDESSAKRASIILSLLSAVENPGDPEVCMGRVNAIFNGEHRIAMAFRDTGKYDENLIRFILNADLNVLKKALEGANW